MSVYVVKAKKTQLQSQFGASDVQLVLNALVDSQGNDLAMASFGDWGAVVIKQGTKIEIVKFDGITQNVDGTATLDVATNGRDILPITPYTGGATGQSFLAGAEVIVTNDPLTVMSFGNLNNANTWALQQTFTVVPTTNGGNAVTDNELVRKLQLDQAVLGITTTVKIIVEGTAGETLSAGNLVYLNISDGRWWKCDADTASSVENVILGIAQGAGTAGNAIASGILLRGTDTNQSGLTAGIKYYASNTAGAISSSAGTKEVSVGISKSTTELYFDPRFDQQLTEDQQDALAGSSGVPSATNKFVTEEDVAEDTASKAVRRKSDSNITVPASPTASTDAVSKSYADSVGALKEQLIGNGSGDIMGIGFSQDGTQMFTTYFNANNQFSIVRWAKDTTTGQYYQVGDSIATIVGSAIFTSGTTVQGIAVIGSYVYVSMTSYVYRFSATNVAGGGTNLTISGTAPSGNPCAMYTDGTSLYINSGSGTTWYRYTISGTTITNAQTLTGPSGYTGAWSDGTKAYLYNGTTLGRYALTLGSVEASTAITTSTFGTAGYIRGVGYASSACVYLASVNLVTSTVILLKPVTRP